jgi:hypothetical protein
MGFLDRVSEAANHAVRRGLTSRRRAVASALGVVLLVTTVALAVNVGSPGGPVSQSTAESPSQTVGGAASPNPYSSLAAGLPSAAPGPSGSAERSPRPTAASPSDTPGPNPTPGPRGPHTFRFEEGDDPGADYSVMVEVVDTSGLVTSARHADPDPPEGEVRVDVPDGPVRMGFTRLPTEPNSLLIMWLADGCNTRDRLTVSEDASVIRLSTPPSISCPNPHVRGHRIVLAFDRRIDITRIRAAVGEPFIGPDDILPNALALASTSDVWVGGWSFLGESFLLHSTNAGDTWKLTGLGWGHVIDVAPLGGGDAVAAADCSGIDWRCNDGLFGTGGLGMRISSDPVKRLSMRSTVDGISILAPYPGGGDCCYWLRPTTTSGLGLPEILNPCSPGNRPADVVKLGASWIETICVSNGANQNKVLLSSKDDGQTWEVFASSGVAGELSGAGAVKGFEMSAGGFGLLWGAGASPSVTTDGGVTWGRVDMVDGEVRVARGGDVLDDVTAALLVWDARRSKTLILITRDAGVSWAEITSLEAG